MRGPLLMASGDPPRLREAVHELLDPVALAVDTVVERRVPIIAQSLVGPPLNHGPDAAAREQPEHRTVG